MCLLHLHGIRELCAENESSGEEETSNLKMEAVCLPETLATVHQPKESSGQRSRYRLAMGWKFLGSNPGGWKIFFILYQP